MFDCKHGCPDCEHCFTETTPPVPGWTLPMKLPCHCGWMHPFRTACRPDDNGAWAVKLLSAIAVRREDGTWAPIPLPW